jgi:hypothetical protein
VVEAGEGLGDCVPGRKLAPVWVAQQSGSQVSAPVRSSGGAWCRGVSVGIGLGCCGLWFWGKLLCPVVGRGGGAGWGLVPGSNTALKLTWLSGGGKRRIVRIRYVRC